MKIICIAKNYMEHVKEFDHNVPKEPVIFTKPDSAIHNNKTPFFYPDFSNDIHYEVEILIKINRVGKNIQTKFAHKYYGEIGVGIDFTARDMQSQLKAKGLPWALAKGFDSSAVISDFQPKENFKDLKNISFNLKLNGELKQQGNTKDMLFNIDEIISYVSTFITLKKGDIIYTGTPSGVGPINVGDVIDCSIEDKKLISLAIK